MVAVSTSLALGLAVHAEAVATRAMRGSAGQLPSAYCRFYCATARCCFLRKEVMAADCDTGGDGAMLLRQYAREAWELPDLRR
jgi:hypothetical protein